MQLAVLDPRPGLGEARVELADIAHPVAEAAAVGGEAPDADHDLLRGMALESGAVEQHRHVVLGRGAHRLPGADVGLGVTHRHPSWSSAWSCVAAPGGCRAA